MASETELGKIMGELSVSLGRQEGHVRATMKATENILHALSRGENFTNVTPPNEEITRARSADMASLLQQLDGRVKLLQERDVILNPSRSEQFSSFGTRSMSEQFGNAGVDWTSNEKAQQFVLGLMAALTKLQEIITRLREESTGMQDKEAIESHQDALVELARVMVGAQPVDNKSLVYFQQYGKQLSQLQGKSNGSDEDFRLLKVAMTDLLGWLTAGYSDRANPTFKPHYTEEQLL